MVILLNFSHPLTPEQRHDVETLVDDRVSEVIDIPCQFDHESSFAEQAERQIGAIGLSSEDWQSKPLLVNPPGLAAIACAVLAELHGRMGYFPPVLRLKPVAGVIPPRFEIAEILDLKAIRDQARTQR